MYSGGGLGSRRARSLPPSCSFLPGSLASLGTSRSARFGPLRQGALNRAVKEASAALSGSNRGRKTQRYPLGGGRRSNGLQKMDGSKKRIPDYTDIAYREAVSRLRYMLADSYNSSPYRSLSQGYAARVGELDSGGEDTVIERTRALLSPYRRPLYTARRTLFPSAARSPSRAHVSPAAPSVHVQEPHEVHTAPATPRASAAPTEPAAASSGTLPPEMMAYIERQEEYIDQLERESQFCREELSGLLGKVKEVISENEGLQERQKSGVLRSVLDYLQPSDREDEEEDEDTEASEAEPRRKKAVQRSQRRMEGPSIVYESRISELEAQLTQVRIDLKKSQDETDLYKRRLLGEGLPLDSNEPDIIRQQLDQLKRERSDLAETVAKLQAAAAQLRERESEATHRLKRAQETAEQVQFERTQSELEVRRLKEELDRLHARLREAVAEQGRRAAEERASVERRYQQQLEQLQSDLASQWDASGRLQLELEKQRRTEAELRRDLACKSATLDEMAKETQAKIDVLQGQLHASVAQHSMLSQELAAAQLQADRAEREGRAESSRLEAEVSALRERLDRADSETLRARQEALRLSEQLAALDREMTLSKIKGVSSEQQPPPALREKELMKMVSSMQEKHVETVAELEGMIESQNQVMAKLKDECHTLTQRLEDSSARHKQERQLLREENDMLLNSCEVLRTQVEEHRYQQQARPLQEQAQSWRRPITTSQRSVDWMIQFTRSPVTEESTSPPKVVLTTWSPPPPPPRGGGWLSPPSRDITPTNPPSEQVTTKLVKESANLLSRQKEHTKEWSPHQSLEVLRQMMLREQEATSKLPLLTNSLQELHQEISQRLPEPITMNLLTPQASEEWIRPVCIRDQHPEKPSSAETPVRSNFAQQAACTIPQKLVISHNRSTNPQLDMKLLLLCMSEAACNLNRPVNPTPTPNLQAKHLTLPPMTPQVNKPISSPQVHIELSHNPTPSKLNLQASPTKQQLVLTLSNQNSPANPVISPLNNQSPQVNPLIQQQLAPTIQQTPPQVNKVINQLGPTQNPLKTNQVINPQDHTIQQTPPQVNKVINQLGPIQNPLKANQVINPQDHTTQQNPPPINQVIQQQDPIVNSQNPPQANKVINLQDPPQINQVINQLDLTVSNQNPLQANKVINQQDPTLQSMPANQVIQEMEPTQQSPPTSPVISPPTTPNNLNKATNNLHPLSRTPKVQNLSVNQQQHLEVTQNPLKTTKAVTSRVLRSPRKPAPNPTAHTLSHLRQTEPMRPRRNSSVHLQPVAGRPQGQCEVEAVNGLQTNRSDMTLLKVGPIRRRSSGDGSEEDDVLVGPPLTLQDLAS